MTKVKEQLPIGIVQLLLEFAQLEEKKEPAAIQDLLDGQPLEATIEALEKTLQGLYQLRDEQRR